MLLPTALLAVVALLVGASIGRRYRLTQRVAFVGCLGVVMLDLTMLAYVAAAAPASGWPVPLAATASAGRVVFAARALPAMVRA